MKKPIEENTIFSDLKVIKYLYTKKYNRVYLCECVCGNTREVMGTHLLKEYVKHCGCKNFLGVHGNKKFEPKESSFRAKAASYKSLAKARGLEFLLTYEQATELLKGNCNYCGKLPSNRFNVRLSNRLDSRTTNTYVDKDAEAHEILFNGIDRVDNTKGYTIENCVTCCTQCNTAKLNYTEDEFKKWIINVYKNYIENGNIPHKRYAQLS